MKKHISKLILMVAGLVIIFLLLDSCNRKKEMYNQAVDLANYSDSVKTYKDKNGKLIDYNKAMKVSIDVAYDNVAGLEEKIKKLKLKKPEVVIAYTNSVEIESVEVPIDIPCDNFSKPFYIDSTHYTIKGVLTDKKLSFDAIIVPNEQTFVVAKKRPKWYKGNEYVVVVDNSNPYVMSEGLQSYTIKPTKKIYQKWYVLVGLGVVGGLVLDGMIK